MHTIVKRNVKAATCLLSLVLQLGSAASSTTSSDYSSITTCPSRTINYITETLPQQCLRTDWSSNATSTEARNVSAQNVEAGLITIEQPLSTAEGSPKNGTVPTTEQPVKENGTYSSIIGTESAAVSAESASPSAEAEPEQEADPLSDNANFLSFEEWKAQMLKKAGQSAEHVGSGRKGDGSIEARRRSAGVNQALDTLGDEGEIELDFSGFVNPDSMPEALPSARYDPESNGQPERPPGDASATPRSKEAGITSKERFNYASFDCAATILKTNRECKGQTSVLLENKDSYMLNPCATQNKFLIVELCNDILVDTIALGNYEFFSSTFRTFRVSISDRYPVKLDKWTDIGTFEARNTRGVQAFLVENGIIYGRYLRIEFLTHYGNEYYCPVSVLRVHGKTMMDDYRNDLKAARGEDDVDDETLGTDDGREDVKVEKIAPLAPDLTSSALPAETATEPGNPALPSASEAVSEGINDPSYFKDKCPRTNYISPLIQQVELVTSACGSQRKYCNLELTTRINATARAFSTSSKAVNPVSTREAAASSTQGSIDDASLRSSESDHGSSKSQNTTGETSSRTESSKQDHAGNSTVVSAKNTSGNDTTPSSTGSKGADSLGQVPGKTQVHPSAATPSTQESFFKSVHKRLQLLEENSTLSLQYIEEQSRILREAFTKVEKRQLNKTTTFLESLNATVLGELREFRLQYDQIWQSTILELSSQREQSRREAVALTARLTLLADEVLWQKRLVYTQFGLILLCLGLIMFSKSNSAPVLELSAFQHLMPRSSTGLSRQLGFESPPGTPSRPSSRYGLFSRKHSHFRSPSNETLNKSPSTDYQSPTPPTEEEPEMRSTESPELAEPMIRRAVSSPTLGQDIGDLDSEENIEAADILKGAEGMSTGLDLRHKDESSKFEVSTNPGVPLSDEERHNVQPKHETVDKQAHFAPGHNRISFAIEEEKSG